MAGLCWSRGSGGGVLWKDSEELLRLGQPECGSWGGREREGSEGQGARVTFLALSPAPTNMLRAHPHPHLTPRQSHPEEEARPRA